MITATTSRADFGATTALAGIDLRIEKGELFGLIGPDGAGKTTFFRIVAGVLAPTSGTVTVDAAATFGFVPQRFSLYEDLSVDENLQLRARLYGVPNDVFRARTRRPAGARGHGPVPRAAGRRAVRRHEAEAGARRGAAHAAARCCCSTSRRPASIPSRGASSGCCSTSSTTKG